MPKLRVNAFAISLDGFGAGPHQSLQDPLGKGGEGLHEWFFPTRTFQRMRGKPALRPWRVERAVRHGMHALAHRACREGRMVGRERERIAIPAQQVDRAGARGVGGKCARVRHRVVMRGREPADQRTAGQGRRPV